MSDEILSQILDELRKTNRNTRLWSVQDIADYFGLSKASAYARIVCKPGFPKPIKLEGVSQRWKPAEVQAWADRKRAA